jgi:hypothetical protein
VTLSTPPSSISATSSDQVFYPSLVVNFLLRFDEGLSVDEIANIPAPQLQDGQVDAVSSADARPHDIRPLVTATGSKNLSKIANRVPKSATVELPAYRTAGKFTLEIDWRELPIDPRIIRAASVEIYIGSVGPDDFSAGMTGFDPKTLQRRSILPIVDGNGAPRDDLLAMVGIVDNWAITRGDASSIKMEGRDLRGIFLDSPINPEVVATIDLKRDIIHVVHDILLKHPSSEMFQIIWNPDDWPDKTPPSVADPEQLTRVRRAADGQQSTGGTSGGDQTSFWDLITQYCFLVGAVAFFRGRNLVIRPGRSLFDQSKPSGQTPPGIASKILGRLTHPGTTVSQTWDPVFGGSGARLDDDGQEFYTRKLIFGRNVKELSFERKYTGTKVPVIQLVSYDTSSKNRGAAKLLTAIWPPDVSIDDKGKVASADGSSHVTSVSPSGGSSQTDVKRISVPGIRDQKKLLEMAKDLYEEIGRGEMGGSCSTGFLASFKGNNSDPDLLRVRPGHAIEFLADTRALSSIAPSASTELALERASFDDAVREIQRILGSSDVNLARVIVASSRASIIGVLSTFRVANVSFSWSLAAGIQTKFDFQNYYVPRYGVTPTTGANTTPAVRVAVMKNPNKQPTGTLRPTKPQTPKKK